jgi:hypothetical protein
MLEPSRPKDLSDKDDPRCRKSRTDNAAPSLAYLRIANEEPRCKKSSTDKAEPTRAKLRRDNEAPK